MTNVIQPFHLLVITLAGWLNRHQQAVSWSSESLLPCLRGNRADSACVSQHLHSADASRCPTDGHRSITKAIDAENCRNALATPRVSTQRLAGVSAPNDSAHQGEWERHSGWRRVRAEMRRAHCAAIVRAVRIEDAHTPATDHDRPHAASCH